jgi:hypothetical protein
MNLPGRLGSMTLGDVLGALYREGATGVLELTEVDGACAGSVHRIHLVGGLVGFVESTVARLGEILRRLGCIDDSALRKLSDRLEADSRRKAGQILLELGAVGSREVLLALRLQRRQRLERLFGVTGLRIAFRVARGSGNTALPPLPPSEFLHGRTRARSASQSGTLRRDPVRARALSTLGLTDAADRAAVQRAFRKLAAEMHPDRFPRAQGSDRADLMRRFAEITAAYHALVA